MTLVAAIWDEERALVAADRAITSGVLRTCTASGKLWWSGGCIVGGAGDQSVLRLLRAVPVPARAGRAASPLLLEIALGPWVERVARAVVKAGLRGKLEADAIVACPGAVAAATWIWDDDAHSHDVEALQPLAAGGMAAIGGGGEVALGALWATSEERPLPRFEVAFKAASVLVEGCSAEHDVLEVARKRRKRR